MTQLLSVDGIVFEFEDNWVVGKYDDSAFYRKQFSRMRNGIKSVDIIACAPDRTAYFIEVKDYRTTRRTKPSSIDDEMCVKILDTIASLLPAKIKANDFDERKLAAAAIKSRRLRVVLHLEQPASHSKLFPRAIDPANVQMKLRQTLKPVDAHPLVTESGRMHGLAWAVT